MTHPIEALMKTAMENIQQMVEVNTIVGDPVETPDGAVIIPVSKVACGFAAGGSEFCGSEDKRQEAGMRENDPNGGALPFGGGSGAGVSVQPVGFLVAGNGHLRLLPIDGNANAMVDRLIESVPDLLEKITAACRGKKKSGEER